MRRKPSLGYRISKFLVLALFLVIIIFPFYWIAITSLKGVDEIFSVPITFWPRQFTLENYRDLFSELDFGNYIKNSVLVSMVAADRKSVV